MRVATTSSAALAVAVLICVVSTAQAENGLSLFNKFLDLATEAQRRKTEQAQQRRFQQPQSPVQRDVTNQGPPAYQVAGLKLGQTIDLKSPELSGIDCNPSETFAEASFCSRQRTVNSPRGAYVETTSLLMSDDDKALYVNQSLNPAFWSDGEVESDIIKISKKHQLSPAIKRFPAAAGQPEGIIATSGNIRLEPITRDDRVVLAAGQSPKIGILVDFRNDLSLSAKQDLPIFRVRGSGYIWATTVSPDLRGKLRFLIVDTNQLSLIAEKSAITSMPDATSKDPEGSKGFNDITATRRQQEASPTEAPKQPAAPPSSTKTDTDTLPSEPAIIISNKFSHDTIPGGLSNASTKTYDHYSEALRTNLENEKAFSKIVLGCAIVLAVLLIGTSVAIIIRPENVVMSVPQSEQKSEPESPTQEKGVEIKTRLRLAKTTRILRSQQSSGDHPSFSAKSERTKARPVGFFAEFFNFRVNVLWLIFKVLLMLAFLKGLIIFLVIVIMSFSGVR